MNNIYRKKSVIFSLSLFCSQVFAYSAPKSIDLAQDFGETVLSSVSGSDLGENYDVRTGQLYHSLVDVRVPGNGGMGIEIRRARRKNPDFNYEANRLIKDWELEIPYIYGNTGRSDFCEHPYTSTFYVRYGSETLTANVYRSLVFWSNLVSEGVTSVIIDGISNDATDWPVEIAERIDYRDDRWGQNFFTIEQDYAPKDEFVNRPYYGLLLSVPGEAPKNLLHTEANTVFSGAKYVTTDNWKAECIVMNGVSNAGFLVTSPDGMKYTFNKSFSLENGRVEFWRQASFYPIKSAENLHKPVHYYPTRIEDKHGNFLIYDYVRDAYNTLLLKKITSSENQIVTLNYSNSSLDNIEANGRRWKYVYDAGKLSEVKLPDNTSWTYQYPGSSQYKSITPYGGEVTYEYGPIRADYFGGRENSRNIYNLKRKSTGGVNVEPSTVYYFYDKDGNGDNRTTIASYKGLEEYVFHHPNDWKMGAMISSRKYDTSQDLSAINGQKSNIDYNALNLVENTARIQL